MRIGFYNPYFDGFGGGERYTLTLASHWSKQHNVALFWDDSSIINKAKIRFDIDLSGAKTTQNIFRGKNLLKKLYLSRLYDLIFFLSDGSIPTSFAKRNILHFQVPFAKLEGNPLKLNRFQAIVCNSEFTKQNLDPRFGEKASVIYPPVEPVSSGSVRLKKENLILSVGRFTAFHQAKKQHEMIESFIKLERSFPDWKLVLAGGLMQSDEEYFRLLKNLVKGHRIKLFPNLSHKQLDDLYRKTKIYWHATGFGETDPKLMEHFGISTAEAMSAGCIPIVYDGGGQTEIVDHAKSGYLWHDSDELLRYTSLVASDEKMLLKIQPRAIEKAKEFDTERFLKAFDSLLDHIM